MDRKPGTLTKNVQDIASKLVWMKVVGIGNTGVGKTCMIKHFCESKFNQGYQPTVGVDYGFKIHNVENIDVRVHLWDLSGGNEYLDVRNEMYSGSDVVFLMYDVTHSGSFENLENWLKEINKYSSPAPEICIVANKIDLKQKRVIPSNESKRWAQQHRVSYYETSCATGEGVETMFTEMLEITLRKKKANREIPIET